MSRRRRSTSRTSSSSPFTTQILRARTAPSFGVAPGDPPPGGQIPAPRRERQEERSSTASGAPEPPAHEPGEGARRPGHRAPPATASSIASENPLFSAVNLERAFLLSPPRSGDAPSPVATNGDAASGFFAIHFFFLARGNVGVAPVSLPALAACFCQRAISTKMRLCAVSASGRSARIVKRVAKAAVTDPVLLSSHSLPTAVANAGKHERDIMRQTRHRSPVMARRYIRGCSSSTTTQPKASAYERAFFTRSSTLAANAPRRRRSGSRSVTSPRARATGMLEPSHTACTSRTTLSDEDGHWLDNVEHRRMFSG